VTTVDTQNSEDELSQVFSTGGLISSSVSNYRERAGQVALAHRVAQCIEGATTLVAEAGTGVGKTFAYLVPALLLGGKTVISTATKPLQDQLFDKDLKTVVRVLAPLLKAVPNAMVLKGRNNYVCHFHLERHLNEGRFPDALTGNKLRLIREFSLGSDTGDKGSFSKVPEDDEAWGLATSTRDNCIGQDCPNYKECFVMRARRRAMAADIVIVNHHLFCADLALRDEGVAEILPSADTVVFDEAHQLPAICSQFMGQTISARLIQQALREAMAAATAEASDTLVQLRDFLSIEHDLREVRAAWPEQVKGGRIPAAQLLANSQLEDALLGLRDHLVDFSKALAPLAVRGPQLEKASQRVAELRNLLVAWLLPVSQEVSDEGDSDTMILWAESFLRGWALHQTPLDVGPLIQRQLCNRPRALVFVSATLAIEGSFTHFTKAMGLTGHVEETFESPFRYQEQALLCIPKDLPEPSSAQFIEHLMKQIEPLLLANEGRAFILCTTLRAVEQSAKFLRASRLPVELLVQGEQPRANLLARFRAAKAPVLIGSASFWEGVDVVGRQLSLVVIDKLPFAPPDDPVLQARLQAAKRRGDDPFNDYQLPAAAIMLKQGAGRLVRSESDHGVLVVGDTRLLTRGYGRKVLRSLPPFKLAQSVQEARDFLLAGGQVTASGEVLS
jgi:ATP-dependent DNA helicase DinG